MKEAAAPLGRCAVVVAGAARARRQGVDALGGGKAGRTARRRRRGDLPAEIANLLPPTPVRLVFETDAGEVSITLDPEVAPVTATRIVELARSGYYDGILVHRVVPGFVTQFGAPHGDGYGGPAGKPALRCETSPLPFAALDVGVALAGRDTGSSQLFVMHARHPHLDGAYAWVGVAAGPWATFVDGDRIRREGRASTCRRPQGPRRLAIHGSRTSAAAFAGLRRQAVARNHGHLSKRSGRSVPRGFAPASVAAASVPLPASVAVRAGPWLRAGVVSRVGAGPGGG